MARLVAIVLALPLGAAFAQDREGVHVFAGPAFGLLSVSFPPGGNVRAEVPGAISFSLALEAPRWAVAAELLAAPAGSGVTLTYVGGRGMYYLSHSFVAPYVAIGLGLADEGDLGTARTRGWGVAPEVGVTLRRDEIWLRPQFALQLIAPFAQSPRTDRPVEPRTVVLVSLRLLL